MTFADGGQWIFRSSTESASSGIRRLWRIVDRNGNIVELEYDINDRLERVINAVGQSLELEYDTNDHILAVVAKLDLQTERRVAYAYYGFRDPDGNLDDLKSVTLPAIVNTVTGNDFPNGTTTTYTYSRGSSAAELNGNLLTIKDSLNQVYLRNTYATTTVSTDYEYDRLVSQTWGEVGDVISIQYAAVTPSSSNGFAVAKAWVNDRVGRVTEHFFDDANQLVSLREYTGFADPDLPTDDAGNLPTGKLRSADPNYFETRYEYNVDGHVANVFHPRGNQTAYVYEVDLNASASRQTRGNLREVHQLGALCNSSIAPVSAYYDYEPGLGNEHGEQNFVVAATDARGSISQAVYDSAGNRTAVIHSELNTREDMEYSAVGQLTRHRYPADQHGQRREVVQTYANDGRLRTAIVDPTGLALTTTQEYDIACNEIRSVDARGYDKLYSYNEHNQLTREQGPLETCSTACGGGTPTRAYTDRVYDANANLVRVDYQALECDGTPQSNQIISTEFEYDILNEDTVTQIEVSPTYVVTNAVELDANRECYDSLGLLVESIEARDNRTLYEYDGAGRLLTTTYVLTADGTGAGAVVGSAVIEQVWDDSDRLIARKDPGNNVTQYQYDSLDRLTTETFADSSTVSRVYDIHDNLLVRTDPNGTVLTMTYDGLERLVDVAVSAGVGVNAETSYESHAYDGRSRLISATDDDSEVTRTYDSLDGLLSETQTYAPNASLTPTPYTVNYTRDGVGNAPVTTYPAGRTISRLFDGLRRTAQIDENSAPLVQLAYLGPSVLRRTYVAVDTQSDYGYDLARRMTSSEHAEIGGPTIDLREYTFDDSGNKQSEQDLTIGSPTGLRAMAHDSLGRMVESDVSNSAASDRTVDYAFDGAGNRTSVTGSACAGTYTQVSTDALVNQYTETPCEIWSHDTAGNLVASDASATVGLDRGFEYDHRGRLVRAWVDPGTVDEVELVFAYDVLGRKIHTTRTDFNTIQGEQYIYDDGNVIEEYVDGGPSPSATYLYGDGLDERLQMIRGESWWYYDDELGSTSAVAYRDAGTLVIERYAYQDYGETTLLSATNSGNPYLFAGSRWLSDVGLYDMRTRHFDSVAGRFISRDSIGIWGDEENLGNGYAYVGNAPDTYTDPTGEARRPSFKYCNDTEKTATIAALNRAESVAKLAALKFHTLSKKSRKKRRKGWGGKEREYWGSYNNVRFNRIKLNYYKIVRRCQQNVIKFKCRSTGSKCSGGEVAAWTHSAWHSTIRLCKNDVAGFFPLSKNPPPTWPSGLRTSKWTGPLLVHEISHNINAIGDKKIWGRPVRSALGATSLAAKSGHKASWNGANYQWYTSL